ncbi:MAG: AMP-binding protein [Candidatus Omnitrophica bacterium]|nr:AMP-binding protein [Candidatus Omnitrophota bacterium]
MRDKLVYHCWQNHAIRYPGNEAIVHWDALGEPFRWTYGSLLDVSDTIACSLIRSGIETGDVCALILRHNKFFYPTYLAIAAIGAIPAVLAYPNARLHPDKFVHGMSGMLERSGLDWILTEKDLAPVIDPLTAAGQNRIKGILFPLEWTGSARTGNRNSLPIGKRRDTLDNASPFLLQHSSGTTGLQKAVVMSNKAILDHVNNYSAAIGLSQHDKVVNWLPLYHDMGLIAAFILPLAFGIPSIQLDPFQWVTAPSILLHAVTREKATLAWMPNFAYVFLADRIPDDELDGVDLSSIRMLINSSEVVRGESHEKFFNRFVKYGFRRSALSTCYAMAEATFAVTQTPPGSDAVSLAVDSQALAKRKVLPARGVGPSKLCVSSGKPIPGCSVKISDKDGTEMPDDRIGTVLIRSDSLFDGYMNDPEKTRLSKRDGWYISGDLGFIHDGECFVIGREDDVIINAGRNIFPEDVEDAVNTVPGVIPGRVVAFGVEDAATGTEKVCLAAETPYLTEKEKEALKLAVKIAGMAVDVTIQEVYLVPPRWLIKSSSGKPSRKTNMARILSGDITRGGT